MAKKKESKNRSVERKVYYYKVTCKCDGTDEPLNKMFDAYRRLSLLSRRSGRKERGTASIRFVFHLVVPPTKNSGVE